MADVDPNRTTESEEQSSYTPASVEKRIAAWIGIVYALMFFFIITFSMYCPNRSLAGTFPLFLVPVAIGIIILSIYKQCKGTARGGLPTTIVVILICLAAAVIGLWLGVPVLVIAFGG
jgi:hypothetical protein